MRIFLVLIMFSLALLLPLVSQAQSEGIAAVVNADAISESDMNDRLNMVLVTSGLPNNAEVRSKLAPQVIGSLIEEQIKLQEARALEIEVPSEEIEQGFATIAQQNNIPPDKFKDVLKQSGINIDTMRRQIESQIAWSKVVQKKLRPQVIVSDNDIDAVLDRLSSNKGLTEYLLAEIFLPVDDPQAENDTRQLAQKLSSEIKKGAPFFKLAQQFSKAAGAAQGGDMGWIQQAQLPEELAQSAQQLEKDAASDPIRSLSGYHILYLRDKRQISDETMPGRDQVMTQIGLERLERLQRRYLLDLKSAAFIENRVGS